MADDEKDLEGIEDDAAGGGRKKLLLIIIGAVLLIAIGAAAGVMLIGGDSSPEEAAAEETAAEPEEVVRPDPLYHEFKPQFVVSLPPGGKARMLQVSLQVMAHDQAVIDFVAQNDPMLRHHLFDLFSVQDGDALYGRQGREALAKAAEKLLEKKMKDGGFEGDVQAVYFTELVLQ